MVAEGLKDGRSPVVRDIQIRVATRDDRGLIFTLLRSAAVWLRARGIDYWQNWHDPPSHHVRWVDEGISSGEFRMIESNGSAIGCLRVQDSDELFWGPRSDSARYIHSLTIDRDLAGRGLGKMALDCVVRQAASEGARVLRLDCGAGAPGLRDYYEACGFEAVGETVVDGERLVLYELPLAIG